jgi:hypothetical protein
MIVLIMFVFPAVSMLIEFLTARVDGGFLFLLGKWFVFWAIGVRFFTAGMRQVLQPRFTARHIFGITDGRALGIVRELGFANLSIGLLGLCSLFTPAWILPAAVAGTLFYGLAFLQHVLRKRKNTAEDAALVSDLWAFIILLAVIGRALWKS